MGVVFVKGDWGTTVFPTIGYLATCSNMFLYTFEAKKYCKFYRHLVIYVP